MECHQDFVCFDEIFGFLGSRVSHLSYVPAKFVLWPLPQSDKLILQSPQFLENYMLHVCSCPKCMRVRTPHFPETKRIYSLKFDPPVLFIFGLCVGEGECSIKHDRPQSGLFISLLSIKLY